MKNCRTSIAIFKDDFAYIILSSELLFQSNIEIKHSGYIEFIINKMPLTTGNYYLTIYFESNNEIVDWVDNAAILIIEDGDYYGTGKCYPNGWAGKTVLTDHLINLFQ